MDKLIADSRNDNQSNQLISGKSDKGELSSLELVSNLPGKNASTSMLGEVTDHFKNTFSNVAKGEASTSEYLEVGAIALGTAAVGTLAAGRLMQRSAPLVFGRSESIASSGTALGEQTNAILANGIKIGESHPGTLDAIVTNGVKLSESYTGPLHARSLSPETIRAAIASAEEVSVSIPKNHAALDMERVLKANQGKDFFWAAPEGSEGALFEVSMHTKDVLRPMAGAPINYNSAFMTDSKISRVVPDLAGLGGELHLNLKGSTAVTDEAVQHFLKAKDTLRSLNITGTGVTENGAEMLRRGLPQAEIITGETSQIAPLARAHADAGLKAPMAAFDRANYYSVPLRNLEEVVFRKPH